MSTARVERVLFAVGAALATASVAIWLHGWASAQLALRAFDQASADAADAADAAVATGPPEEALEFSLWSPRRIQDYKDSLLGWTTPPLAVLRIDRLRLNVPVFEGTSERVLNRGAGWIEGTARPGDPGNVGIAGHRDGVFRGLKDVVSGDRIDVAMHGRVLSFLVDRIVIVEPDDVHVLQARARPSVTLVTCYPFYFVGNAPHRYIVHASIVESARSAGANWIRPAAIGVASEEERQ